MQVMSAAHYLQFEIAAIELKKEGVHMYEKNTIDNIIGRFSDLWHRGECSIC
jgi:hypothetical protein